MSWLKVLLVVVVSVYVASTVVFADTVFVSTWNDTDSTGSAIYRVDPTIQGLIPIVVGFDHLVLGVCGPDGYLYFAERGKHRIIRVSQDGHQITQIYRTLGKDLWHAPEGPSFDPQGNLYWTNTAIGGAWRLEGANPANQAVQIVRQFGTPGAYVVGGGTAILTKGLYAGDLIVSDIEDGVVDKINRRNFCTSANQTSCGEPTIFLQKDIYHPAALAINGQGEIFVVSAGVASLRTSEITGITKFAPDGAFVSNLVPSGGPLISITGIAFDSQDNLWAVSTNAVFRISPSGEKTLVTGIPLEGAGIAVCKYSTVTSAHTTGSQPHFPLELTALWVFLGVYVFKRRVAKDS